MDRPDGRSRRANVQGTPKQMRVPLRQERRGQNSRSARLSRENAKMEPDKRKKCKKSGVPLAAHKKPAVVVPGGRSRAGLLSFSDTGSPARLTRHQRAADGLTMEVKESGTDPLFVRNFEMVASLIFLPTKRTPGSSPAPAECGWLLRREVWPFHRKVGDKSSGRRQGRSHSLAKASSNTSARSVPRTFQMPGVSSTSVSPLHMKIFLPIAMLEGVLLMTSGRRLFIPAL